MTGLGREWDILYWTERLAENRVRLIPFREQLYKDRKEPFTIEENYVLAELIMRTTTAIKFLETAVEQPQETLTIRQYIKSRLRK